MVTNSWQRVRSSQNYREFLRAYLDERELNLSDLARAAGFARGFPSDVLIGKRRLTARSCYAFEKALKLPPPGKKLFRLLVALEEPDVFPDLEPQRVSAMIAALRVRPWGQARRDVKESDKPQLRNVFRDSRAPLVYAAAGEPGRGTPLSLIQERTRLPEAELNEVLSNLEKAGLLKRDQDGAFEPQDLHLFVRAGEQSSLLIERFQSACRQAAQRIPIAVSSNSEMFFASTFCVDEARMPELKAALRETILKFVDESVHPDGNRMVNLVTALHF